MTRHVTNASKMALMGVSHALVTSFSNLETIRAIVQKTDFLIQIQNLAGAKERQLTTRYPGFVVVIRTDLLIKVITTPVSAKIT